MHGQHLDVISDRLQQACEHALVPANQIRRAWLLGINAQLQCVCIELDANTHRAEFRGLEHVHLVDDASVTPGGCVVTSGQGVIDAQIDTQLRRIVELLVPDSAHAEDAPGEVDAIRDIPEGLTPLDDSDADDTDAQP